MIYTFTWIATFEESKAVFEEMIRQMHSAETMMCFVISARRGSVSQAGTRGSQPNRVYITGVRHTLQNTF